MGLFGANETQAGHLFWLASATFGVLLAFGICWWLVMRFRESWNEDDGPAGDAHVFLAALRDSEREGAVSADEFRSIKSELARRMVDGSPGSAAEPDEPDDQLRRKTTLPTPEGSPTVTTLEDAAEAGAGGESLQPSAGTGDETAATDRATERSEGDA